MGAMTVSGSAVVNLVNAIAPIYLCIALGFTSSKLHILPHELTYEGIRGFVNRFSAPFFIFRMVAYNDPYQLNGKLILADTLYKVIALFVLSLHCVYRPTADCVGWLSTLFNLATFSNLSLIGVPFLTAIYADTEQYVATLVFMQLLLWLPVCTFILETYKALNETSEPDFEANCEIKGKQSVEDNVQDNDKGPSTNGTKPDNSSPEQRGILSPVKEHQRVERQQPGRSDGLVIQIPLDSATEFNPAAQSDYAGKGGEKCAALKGKPTKCQIAKTVVLTVLYKVAWAPMVWGSILGFIYALLNFKYNHGKALPPSLNGLLDLMANCTVPIYMFMLGMNIGVSRDLFAGGLPMTMLGVGLRFIVAPAGTAVVAYVLRLRGTVFKFTVMQAMLPQGILSFVWSIQYNLHNDIFSTAVWFQTAIFLPFAIVLEILLNLGT